MAFKSDNFVNTIELGRAIMDAGRHQVDHAFAAALDHAFDDHQPRGHDCPSLGFHEPRPQKRVGDPGLVLDGDEDRIPLARPLAAQDDAGGLDSSPVPYGRCFGAAQHAFGSEDITQEGHRVIFQRQPGHLIIGRDMFGGRHGRS